MCIYTILSSFSFPSLLSQKSALPLQFPLFFVTLCTGQQNFYLSLVTQNFSLVIFCDLLSQQHSPTFPCFISYFSLLYLLLFRLVIFLPFLTSPSIFSKLFLLLFSFFFSLLLHYMNMATVTPCTIACNYSPSIFGGHKGAPKSLEILMFVYEKKSNNAGASKGIEGRLVQW